MPDVLIVGGGFAGIWAAMAAARVRNNQNADLTISVLDPGDDLVIRPRLYEANPSMMRVPFDRILGPIEVNRYRARAVAIHTSRHAVTAVDQSGRAHELPFGRLVLAAGSAVKRPRLPGADHLHDVDSLNGALALDRHLRQLQAMQTGDGQFTAVVVGAGFTGLEVATELVDRLRRCAGRRADEVRVILVERAASISPELGPGPRPTILTALRELGVEVRLNVSLESAAATRVHLTDGSTIPTYTTIWTAGMATSPLTRQVPGPHDQLGRILVDQDLRAHESPQIFAAGDTAAADIGNGDLTMQACQHAIPLGRYAGHNAAADLLGLPTLGFEPEPYVTCLDLGPAGAVFTRGYERVVLKTGREAKGIKRTINEHRIYPPVDNPVAILHAGDPARTWADSGPGPVPTPRANK